ncbi:MAG: hypothetical protein ACXWLH_06485 [Candidatus Saccharimonadales bacterium]
MFAKVLRKCYNINNMNMNALGQVEGSRKKLDESIAAFENVEVSLPEGVHLQFHFSAHGEAEELGDYEYVKQIVKSSDIVILEQAGWDENWQKGFTKLSKGDFKEYSAVKTNCQLNGDTFRLAQVKALYNSKKTVLFVDLPKKDPRLADVETLMRRESAIVNLPDGDLVESVATAVEANEGYALAQQYREGVMLRDLGPHCNKPSMPIQD